MLFFESNRSAQACFNSIKDTFYFKVNPEDLFPRNYAIKIIKNIEMLIFCLNPSSFCIYIAKPHKISYSLLLIYISNAMIYVYRVRL